jgi:hypothetical protein
VQGLQSTDILPLNEDVGAGKRQGWSQREQCVQGLLAVHEKMLRCWGAGGGDQEELVVPWRRAVSLPTNTSMVILQIQLD